DEVGVTGQGRRSDRYGEELRRASSTAKGGARNDTGVESLGGPQVALEECDAGGPGAEDGADHPDHMSVGGGGGYPHDIRGPRHANVQLTVGSEGKRPWRHAEGVGRGELGGGNYRRRSAYHFGGGGEGTLHDAGAGGGGIWNINTVARLIERGLPRNEARR